MELFCLCSYLKGLYSFGLLETRFYDEALKVAKEVLYDFSLMTKQQFSFYILSC